MKTISCKEAVEYILKKEEGKLSFAQRIKLWRHLTICSLCRIFSLQSTLINQAIESRKVSQLKLSQIEKEKIIKNVLNENRG